VITVQGSALPESDCTLTNSLIDNKDNRSIDFDHAVHGPDTPTSQTDRQTDDMQS